MTDTRNSSHTSTVWVNSQLLHLLVKLKGKVKVIAKLKASS